MRRFLHGKAYIVDELNDGGSPVGSGAALVSSANLTQGGPVSNLELGMVHYQPNVVGMALDWHRRLWDVYRLVVIDEAHAYGNVDNTWYAALDRLMSCTPKKLLLLTATPVNNSLWDLHNLFLLFGRQDAAFAGNPLRIPCLRKFFADAVATKFENLSEAKLFPLIDDPTVRRDRAFIEERYPNERFIDGTPVRFPRPELKECRYHLNEADPDIVQFIYDGLTMTRYRPSFPVSANTGLIEY